MKLEVQLRSELVSPRISDHATSLAVVRNIGPDGSGVEFVHMKDEDRDKLRKLVQRHLHI